MQVSNRELFQFISIQLAYIIGTVALNMPRVGSIKLSLPYKQGGYKRNEAQFVKLDAPKPFMDALKAKLQDAKFSGFELVGDTLKVKGAAINQAEPEIQALPEKAEAIEPIKPAKIQPSEAAEPAETEPKAKTKRTRKNKADE